NYQNDSLDEEGLPVRADGVLHFGFQAGSIVMRHRHLDLLCGLSCGMPGRMEHRLIDCFTTSAPRPARGCDTALRPLLPPLLRLAACRAVASGKRALPLMRPRTAGASPCL